MKKILTTLFVLIAMLLPCVALSACGKDNYTGKQFRLTEVSVTFDDTVPQSIKDELEGDLEEVKTQISSEDAPFCRFYSPWKKTSFMLTNCNGRYRVSQYSVDGSNVKIDNALNGSETEKLQFFNDSSLEKATFAKENDNLIMTETYDGITLKYVFVPDGEVNESAEDYVGKEYHFVDVSYHSDSTREQKTKEEYESAEYYSEYYQYGSIKFNSSSTCRVIHDRGTSNWDIMESKGYGSNAFQGKNVNSDSWSYILYIHGDFMFMSISGSVYGYFVKG